MKGEALAVVWVSERGRRAFHFFTPFTLGVELEICENRVG